MNFVYALLIASSVYSSLDAFLGNAFHGKKDYLEAILQNPQTSPETIIETKLSLAKLYSDKSTDCGLYQDVGKAVQLYEEVLQHPQLSMACKHTTQLHLASILAGMVSESYINYRSKIDYKKTIALLTSVRNEAAPSSEAYKTALFYLGGLYAGVLGTLPVHDFKQAKDIFEQLLADAGSIDAGMRVDTHFVLANILSAAHTPLLSSSQDTLQINDFHKAIALYEAVVQETSDYDRHHAMAQLKLALIYVTGPEELRSCKKALDWYKQAAGNDYFSADILGDALAQLMHEDYFKKHAHMDEIKEVIDLCQKLIKNKKPSPNINKLLNCRLTKLKQQFIGA